MSGSPTGKVPISGRTHVFTTHDSLHQELTATGTHSGIYTALMASTPRLAVRRHEDQSTGLAFFEQSPRIRNTPISGTVTFTPESATILLCARGYSGPSWYTALERLGTLAQWSWQPATDQEAGTIEGELRLGANVTAQTRIGYARPHDDSAHAALALIPADRAACRTAWALAVAVLGVLVTDDPAYRSPVLPAPDPDIFSHPVTDYPAAITTVEAALERLDENVDFGAARDHDPLWPTDAEGAAVRALRGFRDALISASPDQ